MVFAADNKGLDYAVLLPATVTIVLTLAGLLYKHFEDQNLQRRKDQLERVNLQLRQLYGPLYALSRAGTDAWNIFRSRHRPPADAPFFDPAHPPSEADLLAYRIWVEEVFMPLNLRLETVIVGNADLLLEGVMPACLVEVCAHVNSYKPILHRWREGELAEHEPLIPFPEDEFRAYVEESFRALQARQQQLLGLLRTQGAHTVRATSR